MVFYSFSGGALNSLLSLDLITFLGAIVLVSHNETNWISTKENKREKSCTHLALIRETIEKLLIRNGRGKRI